MTVLRRVAAAAAGVLLAGVGTVAFAEPAQAGTTLLLAYEHRNYGGASFGVWTPIDGYRCTADTDTVEIQVTNLGTLNDEVSSFAAIPGTGCRGKIWQHSSRTGRSVGYFDVGINVPYVGSEMNDRASAIDVT